MHSAQLLRPVAEFTLRCLTVREIQGRENLPPPRPCIVVANHLSFLDAVLVFAFIGGQDMTAWSAERWRHNLVFGTLLRLGNAFFIERGAVDRAALDRAAAWLRTGRIFGMAPEGTRSRDGGLGQAKTGVAYLADASGAAVLPIAHWGTERTVSSWLSLRRPRIGVRIGQPFHLPPIDPDNRSASLRRNADMVMARLAALLPPAYRGLYADHAIVHQIELSPGR
jgi:1-acyl-sn-glycerol-3-phosphate acyltransferase